MIVFILLIFCISCKTKQIKEVQPKPKPEPEPKEKVIKKNTFLGVYSMQFDKPKKGLLSYSVEFKKDKKARVIIFKKNRKKPILINGKYLFSKKNKKIVILYFPKNIPSEFFFKNNDGSLSLLDQNKKKYKGNKGKIFILKKIQ